MNRNCKKCGDYIPYRDVIDGKERNLKNRVFCLNCSPFGEHNTKNLANSELPRVSSNRRRRKKMAVEYLGGCCSMCGYDKCYAALDFHHCDPDDKQVEVARIIYQWKWDRVLEEINKCILVCSNCHREIHFGLYKAENLKNLVRQVLELQCVVCKKFYDTKNKEQLYCSQSCSQLGCRKVSRPGRDELHKMIWLMPCTQVAKKFGVSDKAVEKWCRTYKIEKPPRGYWDKYKSNNNNNIDWNI